MCWRINALQEFREREDAGGGLLRQCAGDDADLAEAQEAPAIGASVGSNA
jgi:hypothetical protein